MKRTVLVTLCWMLAAVLLLAVGCGNNGGAKVDENKPLADVKAEAEKMDTAQLRATAMKYKDAITDKQVDVEKLTEKIKEIPLTEVMGEEAKGLKEEAAALNKSVTDLKKRFDVYYGKLKERKGDLSGLDI